MSNKENTKTIKTVTHHLADPTSVMRYAYEFLKSYQCEDSKKPRYIEGAVKTFLLESIRLGAIHVSLAEEYETIIENGISLLDTAYGNGEIEEPEDYGASAQVEYAKENIKAPRWYDESIVNNIVEKNNG